MRKMILVGTALFIGLAAVIVFLLYQAADAFYLSHKRAYQLWATRHPAHYTYILHLQGELMHQSFGVEVDQGRLVRLTDVITGNSVTIPPTASTSFLPANQWLRNNLLIDDLFINIRIATNLPASGDAFLVRANPSLFNRMAQAGWLSGARPTCEPNFPQVEYHSVFGYPERLYLHGDPCNKDESAIPVRLLIEDFTPLP